MGQCMGTQNRRQNAAAGSASTFESENPLSEPQEIQGASTLKMVIIMHRHGARFPNHGVPGDLNWPSDAQFWKSYAAQLTPTGSHQHHELGGKMRQRYVEGSRLFDDVSENQFGRVVVAHSSSLQRCIFSAWSFLSAMFPGTPRYFSYLNDREDVDLEKVDAQLEATGKERGIPINVEVGATGEAKTDEMFHQMDIHPRAKKFLGTNHAQCDYIQGLLDDPAAHALVDKLYKMTGIKGLDKSVPMEKRISKCKAIVTQVSIARVHNMPVMPNVHGLSLTDSEMQMLSGIGNAVWSHWFRPVDSNKVSDGVGPEACGFLAAEVARCHDTNLLAFASLLGVDVGAPYFTGHWIVELHCGPGGEWTTHVIYNQDPTAMGIKEFVGCQPVKLPLNGEYCKLSDCSVGAQPADELIDYLDKRSGFGQTARELRGVMGALRSTQGKKRLNELVEQDFTSQMTETRSRELVKAFKFIDSDHSGELSKDELHALFRRIGAHHITQEEVAEIADFFDRESSTENDQMVSLDEFKAMMAALDQSAKDSVLGEFFAHHHLRRTMTAAAHAAAVDHVGPLQAADHEYDPHD